MRVVMRSSKCTTRAQHCPFVRTDHFPLPVVRLWSFFFFSSRRRHTRLQGDWSSDVCSSDLGASAGSMAVSSDGSYVLAGLWADWQQTILILNNQGHVVWGKDAGTIHQVALSEIGRAACRERG